jgi:hypothetical protein
MKMATDIFIFWAAGESRFSELLMRVMGFSFSHCGIGFTVNRSEAPGPGLATGSSEIYFEALFGKGFLGPRPLEDMFVWAAKHPRRKITIMRLGVGADLATEKLIVAESYVGILGYAEWQLLAMWAFERFGRRFGLHVPRSSNRVVCSEAVARILYPQIPLTDQDHSRLDEITPKSLYHSAKAWLGRRNENESKAKVDRGLWFGTGRMS